jgi:hypothetical protein
MILTNKEKPFYCYSADWGVVVAADGFEEACAKAVDEMIKHNAKGDGKFNVGNFIACLELNIDKNNLEETRFCDAATVLADAGYFKMAKALTDNQKNKDQ